MGPDGNNTPTWVYGEDGVEIPVAINDLPFATDPDSEDCVPMFGDGDEIIIPIDGTANKKLIRKFKWMVLKSAIKFFFSR